MKTLKLALENLRVDSFDTTPAVKGRGTVFAEQCTCPTACTCPGCFTCDGTCPEDATCPVTCWYTCDDQSCETCVGPSCQTQCGSLHGENTCTCP